MVEVVYLALLGVLISVELIMQLCKLGRHRQFHRQRTLISSAESHSSEAERRMEVFAEDAPLLQSQSPGTDSCDNTRNHSAAKTTQKNNNIAI